MIEPIYGKGPKGGLMVIIDHPAHFLKNFRTHLVKDEQDLLDGILAKVGITKYYITYAYPFNAEGMKIEGDKFTQEHMNIATNWINAEVDKVRPERILCLGALAASVAIGSKVSAKKVHGFSINWHFDLDGEDKTIFTVLSYPPYFINMNPEFYRDIAFAVKKVVSRSEPFKFPIISKAICSTPAQVYAGLKLFKGNFTAISCDLETTGFAPESDTIEAIGFAGYSHADRRVTGVIISYELIYNEEVKQYLREFFYSFQGYIVFHNGKFDLQFLIEWLDLDVWKIKVRDTLVLNYVLDGRPINSKTSPHGLKNITRMRYDVPDYHFNFDAWNATPLEYRDWVSFYRYLLWDISYTIYLYHDLLKDLTTAFSDEKELSQQIALFDELLMPGVKSLAWLEKRGATIDIPYFQDLQLKYEARLAAIQSQCNELAKEISGGKIQSVNVASTQELSVLLYSYLQLPPAKTDKGNDSTSKAVLEDLREILPTMKLSDELKSYAARFIDEVLKYRGLARALSTYVIGLLEVVDKRAALHAEYHIAGASTGRLSAEKPALHQIPQATGLDIRKGFIPPYDDWVWLKIDFSQLEYRSGAGQSNDTRMIQAYLDGRDIHIEVACAALGFTREEFFTLPKDKQKHYRYLAKFIGFGLMYGRGAYTIANGPELREVGMVWTERQAQDFIDNFLAQFPQLRAWREQLKKGAVTNHYLVTPIGRIRRWPFLTRKTVHDAEREALNFPIQSVASDITLNALNIVTPGLLPITDRAYPVLIVHDEIDYVAHIEEVEKIVPYLVNVMETSSPLGYQLPCPLKVEPEFGPSWGELYPWEEFTVETAAKQLEEKGRLSVAQAQKLRSELRIPAG